MSSLSLLFDIAMVPCSLVPTLLLALSLSSRSRTVDAKEKLTFEMRYQVLPRGSAVLSSFE